jgi:CRISPR type III-B/RAMP module-associated protein Cmr5
MQTLDQRRAAHAWETVRALVKAHVKQSNGKAIPDPTARKFGLHARKLPTRIMASGLGQALAFLVAKDYCPDLLRALSHWVLRQAAYPANNPQSLPAADALLKEVIQKDSDFLRHKTAEALAYLQWLSRFVEAEGLTEDTEANP